jgi:hypothetical protein
MSSSRFIGKLVYAYACSGVIVFRPHQKSATQDGRGMFAPSLAYPETVAHGWFPRLTSFILFFPLTKWTMLMLGESVLACKLSFQPPILAAPLPIVLTLSSPNLLRSAHCRTVEWKTVLCYILLRNYYCDRFSVLVLSVATFRGRRSRHAAVE